MVLQDYFLEHLSFKFNDSPTDISFKACSESLDTHILEGTLYCPQDLSSIEIRADFLMDLFPTQVNMVYFDNGLISRMARLDLQSPAAVIALNH